MSGSFGKKILGLILFIGVIFSINVVYEVSNATSAEAACSAASLTPCMNLATAWKGPGNSNVGVGKPPGSGGGGGNTPGTSGGKAQPAPTPCMGRPSSQVSDDGTAFDSSGWKLATQACYPAYVQDNTFERGESAYCSPIKKSGFTLKSVGVIYTTRQLIVWAYGEGKVWYNYSGAVQVNQTCVYPKISGGQSTKNCATRGSIFMQRTANSAAGTARNFGIQPGSVNIASPAGLEDGSDTCKPSVNMSASVNVPSTKQNWGQYLMSGKIYYTVCQESHATFEGKTKTIYKCGNERLGATAGAKISLWCAGWKKAWVTGLTWTVNDCYATKGYKCTVPSPTFNGKKGTVQALRDGKYNTLNWGSPSPNANVRGARNWEQKVSVLTGSSPYNTSASANSKTKQYFSTPWSVGSWTSKGSTSANNVQNIGFYNASNPNGSFQMKRETRFDGDFLVKTGSPTSYNPWTGAVSVQTKNTWVADTNIKCDTGTSPKIQAVRSIGTM